MKNCESTTINPDSPKTISTSDAILKQMEINRQERELQFDQLMESLQRLRAEIKAPEQRNQAAIDVGISSHGNLSPNANLAADYQRNFTNLHMADGVNTSFHVQIQQALKGLELEARRIEDQIHFDQFIASFGARQGISPTRTLIEPTMSFLHPIPIPDSSQQHRFNNPEKERFMAAGSTVQQIHEALVAETAAEFDEVSIDNDDHDEYDNKENNNLVMANTSATMEVVVNNSRLGDSFDIDFESAFTNEMITVDGESYFEENMGHGINPVDEKMEENGFNPEEHLMIVNGCNVFDKMPAAVVHSFPALFDDIENEHNMLDKMPQRDLVFEPSLIVGLSTTRGPANPIRGVSCYLVFNEANCMLCEVHHAFLDWLATLAKFFALFHRHLGAQTTHNFMGIRIKLIGVFQFKVFDRGKSPYIVMVVFDVGGL